MVSRLCTRFRIFFNCQDHISVGGFLSADIPVSLRESIRDKEYEASRLLALENYTKAETIYDEIFTELFEKQSIEDRRIHLGASLHMKGISLLFQNKFKEALQNFVLAYITDTVNSPVGEESNADQAPARARALNHSGPGYYPRL